MTDVVRMEDGAEGRRASGEGDPALPTGRRRCRRWADLYPPRPKPEGVAYGFLSARGEPISSSRENLLHLARTRSLPSLAWAPETAEMVPPWEVPFLLEAIREGIEAAGRREMRIAAALAAAVVLGFWLLMPPGLALACTLIVAVCLPVLFVVMRRRVARDARLGPDDLRRGFDALVEQRVAEAQPIPGTRRVAAAIAVASAVQVLGFDASIQAGALRLDAVADGEWWRLFTAPMLHGGIWHFWMNYAAMESLGRTMETRGPAAWVPLTFLLSALAGGAASLALPPDVASVGASGGLMGLFGFLAVMAYRRKRHLPEGFLRGLLLNIGLIALVGVVAYRFIDNAAHAGGLLAGVAIGFAAIPGDARVPVWTGGPALQRAGLAATAIVWLSAAAAAALTLAARFGG